MPLYSPYVAFPLFFSFLFFFSLVQFLSAIFDKKLRIEYSSLVCYVCVETFHDLTHLPERGVQLPYNRIVLVA